MSAFVFIGPTICREDARKELEAVYLPPAAQGDVYRAAIRGPDAIGLVDGYFESLPAVWHKEILWALSEGIHVFGSASMGALRAAELAAFGMEGVGRIFEDFRDGVLEDDDEVAVLHGPAETDYVALSEAMVNIRSTFHSAVTAGVITKKTGVALTQIAKGVFYKERSYPLLLDLALEMNLPECEMSAFRAWVPQGRVDQKLQDAREMLRVMKQRFADYPDRKVARFTFEYTDMWDEVVRAVADETDGGQWQQ